MRCELCVCLFVICVIVIVCVCVCVCVCKSVGVIFVNPWRGQEIKQEMKGKNKMMDWRERERERDMQTERQGLQKDR